MRPNLLRLLLLLLLLPALLLLPPKKPLLLQLVPPLPWLVLLLLLLPMLLRLPRLPETLLLLLPLWCRKLLPSNRAWAAESMRKGSLFEESHQSVAFFCSNLMVLNRAAGQASNWAAHV